MTSVKVEAGHVTISDPSYRAVLATEERGWTVWLIKRCTACDGDDMRCRECRGGGE